MPHSEAKIIADPLCHSFPYAARADAQILILGSMPGVQSLQKQQYYAHPQNAFWGIMEQLFAIPRTLPYLLRLKRLTQQGVALWDTAYKCVRSGSLDARIKMDSVVPNNFQKLFEHCPQIRTIFFNGSKAEQLFDKWVRTKMSLEMNFVRLPSTSPAHAHLTREQKYQAWQSAICKVIPLSPQTPVPSKNLTHHPSR